MSREYFLVEAYSGKTGDYGVLGIFDHRDNVALFIEGLEDDKQRGRVRIAYIVPNVILNPGQRYYESAKEFLA